MQYGLNYLLPATDTQVLKTKFGAWKGLTIIQFFLLLQNTCQSINELFDPTMAQAEFGIVQQKIYYLHA